MGINFISIGRLWLVGRSKNVVAISNLSYVVSCSLLALIPNFIQIGQKIQKSEIFRVLFCSVGLVGRKMVVGILNLSYYLEHKYIL